MFIAYKCIGTYRLLLYAKSIIWIKLNANKLTKGFFSPYFSRFLMSFGIDAISRRKCRLSRRHKPLVFLRSLAAVRSTSEDASDLALMDPVISPGYVDDDVYPSEERKREGGDTFLYRPISE